ncbi:MAG: hypothetical protein ABIL68_09685 [bacterium]
MAKSRQETKEYELKPGSKHLIGTLGEKSLHSALKDWYVRPGDRLEAEVDGFHIDIVRRNLLIEIQTKNFSSIRRKLNTLAVRHPVRLVFPISKEKWIVRIGADGETRLGRRKSPKKGHLFQLFEELVSLPELIRNRNFSLEVLLIREEEVRRDDGHGSWRRKGWSIFDRCLVEVVDSRIFKTSTDFLDLMPKDLLDPFTTDDLAKSIDKPRWIAQKMAYCLRSMGAIDVIGKKGNAVLYSASNNVTQSSNGELR